MTGSYRQKPSLKPDPMEPSPPAEANRPRLDIPGSVEPPPENVSDARSAAATWPRLPSPICRRPASRCPYNNLVTSVLMDGAGRRRRSPDGVMDLYGDEDIDHILVHMWDGMGSASGSEVDEDDGSIVEGVDQGSGEQPSGKIMKLHSHQHENSMATAETNTSGIVETPSETMIQRRLDRSHTVAGVGSVGDRPTESTVSVHKEPLDGGNGSTGTSSIPRNPTIPMVNKSCNNEHNKSTENDERLRGENEDKHPKTPQLFPGTIFNPDSALLALHNSTGPRVSYRGHVVRRESLDPASYGSYRASIDGFEFSMPFFREDGDSSPPSLAPPILRGHASTERFGLNSHSNDSEHHDGVHPAEKPTYDVYPKNYDLSNRNYQKLPGPASRARMTPSGHIHGTASESFVRRNPVISTPSIPTNPPGNHGLLSNDARNFPFPVLRPNRGSHHPSRTSTAYAHLFTPGGHSRQLVLSRSGKFILAHSRGVFIRPIPSTATIAQITANIRGGALERIDFHESQGRTCVGVYFISSDDALRYITFVHRAGGVFWPGNPPLRSSAVAIPYSKGGHQPIKSTIGRSIREGATRCLIICGLPAGFSIQAMSEDIRSQSQSVVVEIEQVKVVEDVDERTCSAHVRMATVGTALGARNRLKKMKYYCKCTFSFERDPCGGPMDELIEKWKDDGKYESEKRGAVYNERGDELVESLCRDVEGL